MTVAVWLVRAGTISGFAIAISCAGRRQLKISISSIVLIRNDVLNYRCFSIGGTASRASEESSPRVMTWWTPAIRHCGGKAHYEYDLYADMFHFCLMYCILVLLLPCPVIL